MLPPWAQGRVEQHGDGTGYKTRRRAVKSILSVALIKEMKMADKSSEETEVEKRAAERAAAHKEMKLAVGTPAHHAAVKKHALASEAHAKAVTVAQKAASRARK